MLSRYEVRQARQRDTYLSALRLLDSVIIGNWDFPYALGMLHVTGGRLGLHQGW